MKGLLTKPIGPRRLRLASPTAALILGGLTLLAFVVDVLIESQIHTLSGSAGFVLIIVLPLVLVGVVVARREPRNPIGWLLIGVALAEMLGGDASDYSVFVYRFGHRAWPLGPVAVLLDTGPLIGLALLPLVILLFPDGQLSTRWMWALRGYLALYAAALLGDVSVAARALERHVPVWGDGSVIGVNHPSGVAAWYGVVKPIVVLLFVVFSIASVARQVLCYRGSTGMRRQQTKWLGAGAAACIAGLVMAASGLIASAPTVLWIFVILGWAALPLSIGVGILRYRLYEIDRLISRTLSYAILTALLVGTFIGLIALTTGVLPLSSPVGVAASTLAAAALFNPLRKRVQRIVDRRFNRSRYDADATVAAFSARLRDAVEIDAIRADLIDAVNRAVQPSHASVWIRPRVRD
jgi:hypothetical protein